MASTPEPSDLATALAGLDSEGQLDDVLAMPEHLTDAMWRFGSAGLEPVDTDALVVAGMGGSAIGGDLAIAALGERATKPIHVVRGYGLPSWLTPNAGVLCSSYSGNTEETLAAYEAAGALGAHRIVATTGGALAEAARSDGVGVVGIPAALQPRAAVGYAFVIAAEIAALTGAAPLIRTEIDTAAAHLAGSRESLIERSAELAGQIGGAIPVIYGSGLTTAIAYRWKCQVNENAKLPAFSAPLPEMDHNEIVGWAGAPKGAFAAIFLSDCDQHPRERRRIELTGALVEPDAAAVIEVETEGSNPTDRLLWAVILGDLVSLRLAIARGVDPSPVPVIERLKDQLGRP